MSLMEKPACPACLGSRFICEEHPRRSWPYECSCGAGFPCPMCNLTTPPEVPGDFIWEEDRDGSLHDTAM